MVLNVNFQGWIHGLMLVDKVLKSERKQNRQTCHNYSIGLGVLGSFPCNIPHGEVLKVSQEVTYAQAGARCFAGVCRSNALLGCSNAVIMEQEVV